MSTLRVLHVWTWPWHGLGSLHFAPVGACLPQSHPVLQEGNPGGRETLEQRTGALAMVQVEGGVWSMSSQRGGSGDQADSTKKTSLPLDCVRDQGMEKEKEQKRLVGRSLQGNRSPQTTVTAGLPGFSAKGQNATIVNTERIFQRRPTSSESLNFQYFLCVGRWGDYPKNMLIHALYTCLV